MAEARSIVRLIRAFGVMVAAGFVARTAVDVVWKPDLISARAGPGVGEFGGNLEWLRRYYTPPAHPKESNHYIDLWSSNSVVGLTRLNGLTNNHALFVDSHGKAGCSWHGSGYGFYANSPLVPAGKKASYYSVRDLATVIGPESASKIHNIVLAGCNAEGRFQSGELRRHFPNATNITYMSPGELAFKPMYYQAIVLPLAEIRELYSKAHLMEDGQTKWELTPRPSPTARAVGVYLADLYLPWGRKPYRTVRASRELLEPTTSPGQPPGCPGPRAAGRKLDSPPALP